VGRWVKLCLAAVASVTAIAVPASAMASSGGAGLSAASTGLPTSGPTLSGVTTETASGDGITISTRSAAVLRGTLRFTGSTTSGSAGEALVIERESGQTWVPLATTTTGPGGSFTASWHVNHAGRFSVRAATANGSAASPALSLVVYRPSIATEYGPGFYGHRTACGTVLKRATIGVANRNLPCGSSVSIYYRGRSIVVPVIDRGPYANNANWDLTMATGRSLGMTGTSTIGAIAVSATP
jgi:rare lipoprotein A